MRSPTQPRRRTIARAGRRAPRRRPPAPTGTFVAPGGGPFDRFMRTWWLPLATICVFLLVLAALSVMSAADDVVTEVQDASPSTPVPHESPCIACPLGHRCSETGQCVLIERKPVECVRGAVYDADHGFCVPEATAAPAPRTEPRAPAAGRPTRPAPAEATPAPGAQATPGPTPPAHSPVPAGTPRAQSTPQPTP